MRILCNRSGGFDLLGLSLQHGENIVDDELWLLTVTRLNPDMLAAWTSGPSPQIEVEGPAGAAPAVGPEVSAEADPGALPAQALARDKIRIIETTDLLDELEDLLQGETRKTVIKAAQKRRAIIAGGLG